jgi:hypothetical protein
MYLTKINPRTGLLYIDDIDDGILAIKEFREIIQDEELGLPCMTAIALTADYLSPKRFYSEADRPRAAMEEVTGDRDKFVWVQDKIQLALKKYDSLQYDPTIEEGKIHYQRKVNKLKEYKEAEEYYGKSRNKPTKEGDEIVYEDPSRIAIALRKINDDIKHYENAIQGKDIYEKSPVKNGYTLSRLEQKIEKKSSFYNR